MLLGLTNWAEQHTKTLEISRIQLLNEASWKSSPPLEGLSDKALDPKPIGSMGLVLLPVNLPIRIITIHTIHPMDPSWEQDSGNIFHSQGFRSFRGQHLKLPVCHLDRFCLTLFPSWDSADDFRPSKIWVQPGFFKKRPKQNRLMVFFRIEQSP